MPAQQLALIGGSDPASSSAVAAQQAVLHKQLTELKQLRHDMQAMYDSSQQELVESKAELADAKAEASREREKAAATAAENASLRQWNEQLASDLSRLLMELRTGVEGIEREEPGHEAEEAEVTHLLNAAAGRQGGGLSPSTTGLTVDVSLMQQTQLEASATAIRLTHAQARLKRKGKELRASAERITQLQQTDLASDLASATNQICKLGERIKQQAELQRSLRQLRPRRVDGVTQQVALCDAVHSAGSQLPLRVLGRYICRAPKATSTPLRSEIKL